MIFVVLIILILAFGVGLPTYGYHHHYWTGPASGGIAIIICMLLLLAYFFGPWNRPPGGQYPPEPPA